MLHSPTGVLVFLRSQNTEFVNPNGSLWNNKTTYGSFAVLRASRSFLSSQLISGNTRVLITPETNYTENVVQEAFADC